MHWLKQQLFDTEPFRALAGFAGAGRRVLVKNVPGALPVLIADYLCERCGRTVLFVAETLEDAEEYADDLTTLIGEARTCLLPGRPGYQRELTPVEQSERAEVLLALARREQIVVITPAAALLDPLPDPDAITANLYTISKGESLPRQSLLEYLSEAGYQREMFVEGVGQFAVRGAVVDIYPFGSAQPVRIEFFDEEVESLRRFDSSTQISIEEVSEVTLVAAEPGGSERTHLLQHLPEDSLLIWGGGRATLAALKRAQEERSGEAGNARLRAISERFVEKLLGEEDEDEEYPPYPSTEVGGDEEAETPLLSSLSRGENEDYPPLIPPTDVEGRGTPLLSSRERGESGNNATAEAKGRTAISLDEVRRAARKYSQYFLETAPGETDGIVDFAATPQERFAANLPLVADRLKEYHAQGIRAVILCDTQVAGERLAQVLMERGCPESAFEVRENGLHHGFTLPAARLAVLVDHDIFGRMRRRRRFMKFKNVVPLHDIDALKPGDFVVHVDYGIGRYLGLTKIEVNATAREVLKIEYRDGVTLFVKLENLAQVQKYSGREGFQPPLSKIGGRDWRELKKKTKRSLVSIAEDLIKLYAERKAVRGHEYSPDTPWQREMEASFPYEDTVDQMRAAEEVKRDMESAHPMDRLICGDVGYGKTEIAMRATFKAVTDGKQVAVLVPTTILAQQHYRTFRERFRNWPIRVEVMSRFQSAKEQRITLQRLSEGNVDVLIGTHRILSKDVQFHDLGLLIIDEEHRFGVVQKERIKSLRANIDVLSMSATPIPRTLHMALMGARDLSQVNTPPPNRQPIETDVVQFSEKTIRDAILYELERGGQVFFVHNRVQSIPAVKEMLQRLLPKVRFGIAHGQMDEDKLARVMVEFMEGQHDVLICTMIVESGLDLPNVNTMIVNRADRFGVAQLHQLRGRIGRSSRKAYAYLVVPPKFEMSRIARQRLAALTNFSSLGAGFQLAMRDLEIRGAGNILGREQSGYINAVGFEMYQRLIEEAMREVQVEHATGNGQEPAPVEVKLKLDADAFFPENYMPEGSMRLNYYREMSRAKNLGRVDEIEREVADRFGRLPDPARNLLDMVRVRVLGESLGAEKIAVERARCTIEFPREGMPRERVLEIAALGANFPVEFSASGPLRIYLPLGTVPDWRQKMELVLRYLTTVSRAEKLKGEVVR